MYSNSTVTGKNDLIVGLHLAIYNSSLPQAILPILDIIKEQKFADSTPH